VAYFYDQVKCLLPAGETGNIYYGGFPRTHGLGMESAANYERIEVPSPVGHLPGFRLQAYREIGTFVLRKPCGYAPPLFPSPLLARYRARGRENQL
jgi:hypothetical protein